MDGTWIHQYPKNHAEGHNLHWAGNPDQAVCNCNPKIDSENVIVLHRPLK